MSYNKEQLEKILKNLKEIRFRLIKIKDEREINKLMSKLKNGKF